MKVSVFALIAGLFGLNAHALVGAAKIANGTNKSVVMYVGNGDCNWDKAQMQGGSADFYRLGSDIEYLLIRTDGKDPAVFPIRREGTYLILVNANRELALFDATENGETPLTIRALKLSALGCNSF
jgi:hypothetical protein